MSGGFPWSDPDAVMDPAAPPTLFYHVTAPDFVVRAVKDGLTVRIE